MDISSLQLTPTEGDLAFPISIWNANSNFHEYWGLELDSNLGSYTNHTFNISEWLETKQEPPGRKRFILLRDFLCDWNGLLELENKQIFVGNIQLRFRFRNPDFDSVRSSKSPIFSSSFRVGNHLLCSSIEKKILINISQIISPTILEISRELTSENIRFIFWKNLRYKLPIILKQNRWLGFYGGDPIPNNISFRPEGSEKFIQPKIRLRLYEKPNNLKNALLGRETLIEIITNFEQSPIHVKKHQILKLFLQFRSKTFTDILHLEPELVDKNSIGEYRYPKFQEEPLLQYKWNYLLSEIGVPWSKTKETNYFRNEFEKDPREVIYPENLVGPEDPQGLMFSSTFGYEALFIVVSPIKLAANWFNQSDVNFSNWAHTEEAKMAQIPVAFLTKCLRRMLPQGTHIYNFVFKNSN